jgi:ABC-2 type transport system permease protein
MFALIRFETRKAFSQNKCLLGVFAIAMVNALFVLGFFLSREQPKELLRRIGPELLKEFFNGCVYAQTVLAPCALILFPVLVAVIVSYVFAGELEIGHMRMTLVRPPSRVKILLAKWCAVALYTGLMLLALLCVSYLFALVLMKPSGDLIVIGDAFGIHKKFILHPAGMEAWGRVALSYALAWPALLSMSCMAFLFATLSRNFALSAILGSTVYLSSYVVGELPFLSGIHRFLPTSYMPFWKYALLERIPWDKIAHDALWTGVFSLVFLALAAALFERGDF